MPAYRVVEPSGSIGEIQLGVAGSFDSDANFVFAQATKRLGLGTSDPKYNLHVVGDAKLGSTTTTTLVASGTGTFLSGLSGSLTRLVDGTSFLIAGDGITLTTGSNGAVTIASTGGGITQVTTQSITQVIQQNLTYSKFQSTLTGSLSALSPFTVIGADFGAEGFRSESADVYVNGQLLTTGSLADITSGSNDYSVVSSDSLKFGFNLFADDSVVVRYATAKAKTNDKYQVTANSLHSKLSLFEISGSNFAKTNYLLENIDVYLNGEILYSGSLENITSGTADYFVASTNQLQFSFDVLQSDSIIVRCTNVK